MLREFKHGGGRAGQTFAFSRGLGVSSATIHDVGIALLPTHFDGVESEIVDCKIELFFFE